MNPKRFRRIRRVLTRRQPDLTVLMERVNKSHNFSAILRNCDAVGILEAHAVFPERGVAVSKHASAGTAKWVGVWRHKSVGAGISRLKESGFRVLAAHPSPDAVDYRDVDYSRKVAILVGAELDGLSPEGLAGADERVLIPMAGMARSLNVSVATALILFEAYRQRKAAGMYETSRLPPETFQKLLFEWCHPELADFFQRRGLPYPPLSEDGEALVDPGFNLG
ncbi:MAG: tRNA (guanosine(18)-2'-O)-methyltransferase TrmH [Longimicrobiales bacterium]